MNKKYQQIKIPGKVTRLQPKVKVFAFERDGTKVYTGSLDCVTQYFIDNKILCHGLIGRYFKGKNSKATFNFVLCGSTWLKSKTTLHLVRLSKKSGTIVYSSILPQLDNRIKYRLIKEEPNRKMTLLGSWRKLPNAYLRELDSIASEIELDTI